MGPHPDGEVITFGDEIDVSIAQVQVHADLRVQRPEGRQQGQDAVMTVGGGQADAQLPGRHRLRAHHFLLRLDQLRQRLAALLEIGLAGFRQANAAGGAHEKP
nr:hypothetical protein GCM10020185_71020 [Pseudomonas brassicacearum subsp. brassicacearum]